MKIGWILLGVVLVLASFASATQYVYRTNQTGDNDIAGRAATGEYAFQSKFNGTAIPAAPVQIIDQGLFCVYWEVGGVIGVGANYSRMADQYWNNDSVMTAANWNEQNTTNWTLGNWNSTADNTWGCLNVTDQVNAMYDAGESNLTIRVYDNTADGWVPLVMFDGIGLEVHPAGPLQQAEDSDNIFGTGNYAILDVTFHNEPPVSVDFGWNITNNTEYSPERTYVLWAEWTDDTGLDTVVLSANGINNSFKANATDNYSAAYGTFGAGSYPYYSCANDTDNQWTCTATKTFTVTQNNDNNDLTVEANLSTNDLNLTYGQQAWFYGWSNVSEVGLNFYYNSTDWVNGTVWDPAGGTNLNMTGCRNATTNYSSNCASRWINTVPATSGANLLLNGTDGNEGYYFEETTNASGYCLGGTLNLTRNGSTVGNPDINELAIGTYNYTVTCHANANYTTTSEEHHAHVALQGFTYLLLVKINGATVMQSAGELFFHLLTTRTYRLTAGDTVACYLYNQGATNATIAAGNDDTYFSVTRIH